jgi:S-adenosylmethionine:tRNA ribosyltransferase-isomerase
MQISEYDYNLPEDLIAQQPLEDRSAARMLVVERATGFFQDRKFSELPSLLTDSDVLVLNNTRVFPARLFGEKEGTGARIEVFLIKQTGADVWETLVRPARRLRIGDRVVLGGGKLAAELLKKNGDGSCVMAFSAAADFFEMLEEIGKTPLPPYIKRKETPGEIPQKPDGDRDRYQTIYARERGAIAAPTAGLHFTPQILTDIRQKGVEVIEVTLHVGYGTFEPVRSQNLSQHSVAPELAEITPEAAAALNKAKDQGRRIVAVGTTTTRALESFADENGRLRDGKAEVELTIVPGYEFRFIDALLTNFHLPQSSLLVLVSTFMGKEPVLRAYRHAVEASYRFYSYGDCMLII